MSLHHELGLELERREKIPESVRRCTTHHHACDCREYEFEQAKANIEALTAEVEEQARLLGASGSREAELLARVEALEAGLDATVTECMAEKSNNDIRQTRIEALEKALIEIAEAGCEFSYLSGDADTCETPEAGQPRGDWCNPCIANAALLQEPTK